MVHIQKWDGKETSLVREVNGNALTLVGTSTHDKYLACMSVCLMYFNFSPFTIDTHTWSSCLHTSLREGRVKIHSAPSTSYIS